MATAEELITDNIDLWTGAIKRKSGVGRGKGSSKKIELYGVKKLRELILEMAVRGLLVPQDTSDEPASVLLERIAAEKAELVKEKKIKKQKALPSITDQDKLPSLPKNWEWSCIAEVGLISPRNEVEDEKEVSFIPMPLISTSHSGLHEQESRVWSEIKKGYTHFADGDIAVAKITPCFENSKAAIFSGLRNGVGSGSTELHVVRPFSEDINRKYLLLYLKSPRFLLVGATKMTGSAGQKRVPKEFFSYNPLPLPPLAEQHRIVAKVEELMALCDQLEQQTEANISAHQTLVETLLQAITCSDASANSAESIELLFANFDNLFTTEDSVDQLKQTILQLAVMGKLVPQDPSDEPASILLEGVADDKQSLLEQRKVKYRNVPAHPDIPELLHKVPSIWSWSKFNEVAFFQEGPGIRKWQFTDAGIKLLNVSNIRPDGSLDFDNSDKFVSSEEYSEKYIHFKIDEGDLLFAGSGGSWGKSSWFVNPGFDVMLNTSTMRLKFFSEKFSPKYLKYFLDSNCFKKQMVVQLVGIQPNFGSTHFNKIFIPVPPSFEQHRIVTRVDELMTLCDQLKAQLNTAQTTQLNLADAVTEQAIV